MPKVSFTAALKRFFPTLQARHFEGKTLRQVLEQIEAEHPGISDYLIDEEGKLRKHINIFIGEKMIEDRLQLSDVISEEEEILIFQALSGG